MPPDPQDAIRLVRARPSSALVFPRTVGGPMNEAIAGLREWHAKRVPACYQTPDLTTDRLLAGGLVERLPLESLVRRLGEGRAETWYVQGGPGTGKTSLTHAVATALFAEERLSARVDLAVFSRWGERARDVRGLVESIRPAEIDERLWKSRAKKGNIALLVDGVNEIGLRYRDTASWSLLQDVLAGNHPFPVLASSRHAAGDLDDAAALRTLHRLELPPFRLDQIERYIDARGVGVTAAKDVTADAGLEELASNPMLLARIVDLVQAPGGSAGKLPRCRAGILLATLEHADAKRVPTDPAWAKRGLTLRAVVAAAALCAAFGTSPDTVGHPLRFRVGDLQALVASVWPGSPDGLLARFPAELHLAEPVGGHQSGLADLMHHALRDFGFAMLVSSLDAAAFLTLDDPDLSHALGDWVGLNGGSADAVSAAIEFARRHERPDLLVDVGAANEGIVSERDLERLWTAVGEGLVASRAIRQRCAGRLAGLSRHLRRRALGFGLVSRVRGLNPPLAASLAEALQSRTFDAESVERMRRQLRWSRRPDTTVVAPNRVSTQLAGLLDTLRTGTEPWQRGAAATQLGRLRDPAACEALSSALRDPAANVRGSAATALGAIGDRSVVEALIPTLRDEVARVRGSAATALGAIGDRAAVMALVGLLDDASEEVRGSSATALGAIGDRAGVDALVAALSDPASVVRGSAATALGAVGERSAAEALVAALGDPAPNVRAAAATALGVLGDRAAVAGLLAALVDMAGNVRGSAATALGVIGDRSALATLIVALEDADAHVRGSAATALGAIGDRSAVAALIAALEDLDANVRGSAATALGAIADRSAVAALINTLKDAAARVRGAAATALGAVGDRAAVNALVAILEDEAAAVRGSAATALGAIGDRSAVQALIATLEDPAAPNRGAAATALGAIGDRAAVTALVAILGDPAAEVRGSAATALGAIGDRSAVPALIAALTDDVPVVRYGVATALGVLGDPSAVGALAAVVSARPASRDAAPAAEALRRLADRDVRSALEPLRSAVCTHPVHPVRTTAVMALAAHDALDDGTVRTLLAPVDPRWDGRPRDTDRGVQGQTAAGVLRAYRRGSPTAAQLDAVVTWMRDPAVHRDAINAAISVLLQLPASAAARALADIQPRLRVATEPVTRGLERVRAMVSHAEEAERSLARLRAEPADALRTVFSADHTPWFKRSNMPAAPTVLLVTAISTEARSVLRALKERGTRMESTVVNGRTVDRGTFAVAGGRSVSLILAQAVEKGPQAMQAMVASLLGELNPALVLMVGVCGGLPEHGAAQNSVVLARQLHNYERRRERGGLPRLTPQVYRCSPAVIDRVNAAERHGALDAAEIGGVRGVKLHLKDMASGEGLVDDLRSPERQLIVALSDDLVGVEMEGHGLYHEMWERALQGRHDVPYAMIKGVGDFCDGQMTTDKDARQDAATRRALELALAIIERW